MSEKNNSSSQIQEIEVKLSKINSLMVKAKRRLLSHRKILARMRAETAKNNAKIETLIKRLKNRAGQLS